MSNSSVPDGKQILELLKSGKISEFNEIRKKNSNLQVDLTWENLREANLEGAYLCGHNFVWCRSQMGKPSTSKP